MANNNVGYLNASGSAEVQVGDRYTINLYTGPSNLVDLTAGKCS